MAVVYLCGFEMGHVGEFTSTTGTCSVQSSIKRTGTYAFRSNPTAGTGFATITPRKAGGTLYNFGYYSFALYVATMPDSNTDVFSCGSGSVISINSSGNITYGTTTSSNALSTGRWYVIRLTSNGSNELILVDGVQWVSNTIVATGGSSIRIGIQSGSITADLYFDDVAVDDGSTQEGPLSGRQVLLLPTADPGSLNSWTNGGGGTTSIFEGVNNIPPTGAAAATNGIKIKNAASGGNLDYTPTMQTYIAAGIPVGSKINAVMAICNDGEEAGTATKAGGVWVASNPAQAAGGNSFDYGDDGGALGTFPTGWKTHYGPVTENPSVTLSTAPTMTVRKTTSTTRVVNVDFMGIYVDYTPPQIMGVIHQPTPAHFNAHISY